MGKVQRLGNKDDEFHVPSVDVYMGQPTGASNKLWIYGSGACK